jgi:hypothetical protein
MTEYYNSAGYMEDEPQHYDGETWEAEPIPVKEITERAAPEYGACMTWSIPQAGIGSNLPVQIFQRRLRRNKGKLTITALNGATSVVFNSNLNALTSNQQGAAFTAAGNLPDWESQQPLYAFAIGGGPASVACWDEAYAER